MNTSLRDQLLAAGLVSSKQAKQAKQASQQEKQRQFHGKPAPAPNTAAQQAQAAKTARDQQLNRRRQEKAERRARLAQIELLIEHGVALHSATQSIRAQLAEPDLCARIDAELGAPLLFVERTLYDASGQPVDFVRSWYRGDKYEYAVTLSLNPGSEAGPYLDLA